MSIKLLMNHLKRAMLYSYAIYMGQLTGNIRIKQKYLLYCPKCKKTKWYKEKESKAILEKQKLEKEEVFL